MFTFSLRRSQHRTAARYILYVDGKQKQRASSPVADSFLCEWKGTVDREGLGEILRIQQSQNDGGDEFCGSQ